MRTIGRHIIIMAIAAAAAEVIKAVMRAKPDAHMQYVDYLYQQAKFEAMRFERLHVKGVKDDAPPPAPHQR
jgi:hypothetical protein